MLTTRKHGIDAELPWADRWAAEGMQERIWLNWYLAHFWWTVKWDICVDNADGGFLLELACIRPSRHEAGVE